MKKGFSFRKKNGWLRHFAVMAVLVSPGFAEEEDVEALNDDRSSRPVQVLLVTGQDLHDWRSTTPVLKDLIEEDTRLGVTVVEDPSFLASEKIHDFDVMLHHWMDYNVDPPGEEARTQYKRFVYQGKGLVLVHFACGAFQDWPEFAKIAGRVWDPKLRGHDPRGGFQVEIVDKAHPITKGLPDFQTDDELYTCLAGEEPIHVLAQAVSKVDGKPYPMAFVHRYGKGNVFHCVLGHDPKAFRPEGVKTLFRRGCAWAAGVSVPRCDFEHSNAPQEGSERTGSLSLRPIVAPLWIGFTECALSVRHDHPGPAGSSR